MQESSADKAVIFVGWALLPVEDTDGQECSSYKRGSAIDVGARGSRRSFTAS